ncbi:MULTISPECIES: retropepsin-like aspartic protease family protein [Legionella]|uniref:Aspartyl protease n=1 Tax=Legionella donaldsonii TaxID=45060 RepID=A0A378J9N8_9GAMM|nr:retropepsin-like aspartic protease [Legionella donaldsonii]MCC5014174.1 retroviral-like aspartic protease family protein [Legionella sp. 31fI33]STX43607.1 Aspartyl protease [Legionella donaldsonii]
MVDKQYTQTGRWMFLIAWLLFFGLLLLFFYYYGEKEQGSYQITHGSVTIVADEQGHYYIDGSINDYPVKFILDTGATLVAIPQWLAAKLQLQGRYPISIQTASGEVTGTLTRLKQLSFAKFTLNNVKAVIVPGSDDDTILLGMNVLSQFNLSQQDKQLIIKK